MLYDRKICKKVMQAAIIMHNVIVETRRNGYDSSLFEEAKRAVENRMLLEENENEAQLKWKDRSAVLSDRMSDVRWTQHLAERYKNITDELKHYSMKNELVEHIRNRHGLL